MTAQHRLVISVRINRSDVSVVHRAVPWSRSACLPPRPNMERRFTYARRQSTGTLRIMIDAGAGPSKCHHYRSTVNPGLHGGS